MRDVQRQLARRAARMPRPFLQRPFRVDHQFRRRGLDPRHRLVRQRDHVGLPPHPEHPLLAPRHRRVVHQHHRQLRERALPERARRQTPRQRRQRRPVHRHRLLPVGYVDLHARQYIPPPPFCHPHFAPSRAPCVSAFFSPAEGA